MRTVELTHLYNAPPQALWDIVIDYDCLAEVMQGLVSFEGLPIERIHEGQTMKVTVSLFGKLPAQPYYMEVVTFDEDNMILASSERGVGVQSWRHTLRVEATATGSKLSDTIEIDAGWCTGLFALWARFLYSKRHKPRLRILERRRVAA